MYEGRVEWFNDPRGYGSLSSAATDRYLLVHQSAVQVSGFRTLTEGQRVYFQVAETSTRLHVMNVYPEELYAQRLRIPVECGPDAVNRLIKNSDYLGEVRRAYEQLPFKTAPGRAWCLFQLVDFEPARLTLGDVQNAEILPLENFISDLEAAFQAELAKTLSVVRELARSPVAHHTDRAIRLEWRLRSLNAFKNKWQARTVFEQTRQEALELLTGR